jgi:hypothetical protein
VPIPPNPELAAVLRELNIQPVLKNSIALRDCMLSVAENGA